ncbi:MAG: hypothetical protein KIS96_04720 [Bauldia sp.]|nr:hypothetical protein [Bauldia sp.]
MRRFQMIASAIAAIVLTAPAFARECSATRLTGSTPQGVLVTATSAVAVSLMEGRAYQLLVADYELSLDEFRAFLPLAEPPRPGVGWGVDISVYGSADLRAFSPLEVGQVIEAGLPFGERQLHVTAFGPNWFAHDGSGAQGAVILTAVGDMLCGTIDYSDGEKWIRGTFAAPTKQEFSLLP